MLIAVDNQIPYAAVQMIEARGFHVVVRAKDQADKVWFEKGVELGAEVFVSPDRDIFHLCCKHGKKWLKLKQGLRGIEVAHFVTKRLYEIKAERGNVA
jgi:hypothetical protein